MGGRDDGAAGGPAPDTQHQDRAARPARLSVAHCSGCGHAHGLGWCGHAMRLTDAALRRGGVRFNWR